MTDGSEASDIGGHPAPSLFTVAVIGTRAQLIKMAPVLRELEARNVPYRLIFTGQHLVTMTELLGEFGLRESPVWLGHKEIDSLGKMVLWFPVALWRLAVSRRQLLRASDGRQGLVIVHGDTVSTLLGALAGRLNRCRVAHVESGLRSFNLMDPFPEELTRVLVFRLIDIAFCPGAWAAENMSRYRAKVFNTLENTLLDAVRFAADRCTLHDPSAGERLRCVVSIHRHENLRSRDRLTWILDLIQDIGRSHEVDFVLHPSTLSRLKQIGRLGDLHLDPGVSLHNRMGYLAFMAMISSADFVLTDGGSNQEELSYLGIPTLIARECSERPEGLGNNAELLPRREGLSWQSRLAAIRKRIAQRTYTPGDVHPSEIIVNRLARYGREVANG